MAIDLSPLTQISSITEFFFFTGLDWVMVFNVTFNNISVISCRSVLLVENPVHGDVYSIQHYVSKFVLFPPSIKLTARI